MNLNRFLTPSAAKPGKGFILAWTFAHGIAWAIFIPLFAKVTGECGNGQIPRYLTPCLDAPIGQLVLGLLLICSIEGLAETILLARYLPSWLLWLPVSLLGWGTGALLAQSFPPDAPDGFNRIVVVVICVSLLQWLLLAFNNRWRSTDVWLWPFSKVIAGPLAFFGGFFGMFLCMPGLFMGIVWGFFTSLGMKAALSEINRFHPTSHAGTMFFSQ